MTVRLPEYSLSVTEDVATYSVWQMTLKGVDIIFDSAKWLVPGTASTLTVLKEASISVRHKGSGSRGEKKHGVVRSTMAPHRQYSQVTACLGRHLPELSRWKKVEGNNEGRKGGRVGGREEGRGRC